MSAYVVSHNTINAIVTYGATKGIRFSHAGTNYAFKGAEQHCEQLIAAALYKANVESVNYRYGDEEATDGFEFRRYTKPIPALHAIKLCDCLEYQSCEVERYEDTLSFAILAAVRRWATGELPGYDAAPWGLE